MNTCPGPPEPSGKWPLIGHFHLLGANKILHHTLGDMADRYGPVFSLKLGINRTLVVTSWEVAKECFTTQDKVFASRPTSVVGKVAGYNNRVMIFQEYGSYWREIRKLAVIELLTNRRLEMLKHVRESEVNVFIRELYEQWSSNGNGSKVVVEMKERFGDLTTNIVVRTVTGRRSCPGITFAIQVLHLTLARLVHGFKLGTVLGSRVDMTESSGVSNPKATLLEVTLTPRLPPAVY
uniref:Cytochrome P450 n=1 Tax=Daucus carota subsp. sativus TaxID=79200 RepID=A0A161ZY54_DAUCS